MWPKWLRGLLAVWVAYDSRARKGMDLFWVLVVLILGPLLVPFYLAARPLLPGEVRRGSFWWNALWNFEKLFSTLVALASAAVFYENMSAPKTKEIAEVKLAEMKAGTILGLFVIIVFFVAERIGFDAFREWAERDS